MTAICGWFGVSRQAHNQMKRRQMKQQQVKAQIIKMVQAIRAKHPRMGCRKLLVCLTDDLLKANIRIGRDKLFALLRQEGLLVQAKCRQWRTTVAGSWRCENLLEGVKVDRPNQVWVSDITYIQTEKGFNYLALVTDLYSRRIVGYDLSNSLAHEGVGRAFKQAVKKAGRNAVRGLIHHSDRGTQYTSKAYRQLLRKKRVRSSMGATGNCYDNAVAERVNGIIKLEYGLDSCFVSTQQAKRAIRESIWLYNHERPHLSLQMQKPDDVYHRRKQHPIH